MSPKRITYILSFSFIAFIYSCTTEKAELPKPEPKPPDCDTTGQITYTNYVKAVLVKNCSDPSSCHSGSAGTYNGDYTVYSGIKAKVDNGSFRNRVLKSNPFPMPPPSSGKSLTDCEKKKLEIWVNNGAPQ